MTKRNNRYAKRLVIPITLRNGKKFMLACVIIGTYKDYDLDLWHRELILSTRTVGNIVHQWMDNETTILYYTI